MVELKMIKTNIKLEQDKSVAMLSSLNLVMHLASLNVVTWALTCGEFNNTRTH